MTRCGTSPGRLAFGAPGYLARIDDGRHVTTTVAGLADTATRQTYFANPRAANTGPGYAHGYAIEFAATPARHRHEVTD